MKSSNSTWTPPGLSRPPRGGRGLKFSVKCVCLLSKCGRPPRGGRGLKFTRAVAMGGHTAVAPLAGGVD